MTAQPGLTLFFPPPTIDRNKWLRPALMSSDDVEWYTPPQIADAAADELARQRERRAS